MAEPKPPVVVKLFGLEIPLERWAVHCLGALVVAAVGIFIMLHLIPEWTNVLDPKRANAQLAEDVSEYGLHAMETPEHDYLIFDDARGKLSLRTFADGCLIVQKRNNVGTSVKLIRDLSRPSTPPSPRYGLLPLPAFIPTLEAAGRCLSPHPGPFAWKYGQQQGCWVEVWRHWEDGCEHVQMFNVCSQLWQANTDGSPQVRWTHCNH